MKRLFLNKRRIYTADDLKAVIADAKSKSEDDLYKVAGELLYKYENGCVREWAINLRKFYQSMRLDDDGKSGETFRVLKKLSSENNSDEVWNTLCEYLNIETEEKGVDVKNKIRNECNKLKKAEDFEVFYYCDWWKEELTAEMNNNGWFTDIDKGDKAKSLFEYIKGVHDANPNQKPLIIYLCNCTKTDSVFTLDSLRFSDVHFIGKASRDKKIKLLIKVNINKDIDLEKLFKDKNVEFDEVDYIIT